MFLLLARYTAPAEEVDRFLEEHKEWIRGHYEAGRFLLTAREVPLVGGLILATGTREELEAAVAQDPFRTNGLAEYEIREFAPVRAAEGYENLLALQPAGA